MFLFLSPRLLEKEKDKLTSLCVSVGFSFFLFLSVSGSSGWKSVSSAFSLSFFLSLARSLALLLFCLFVCCVCYNRGVDWISIVIQRYEDPHYCLNDC